MAAIPGGRLCGAVSNCAIVWIDLREASERHRAERDDENRIDGQDLTFEPAVAVGQFGCAWRAIAARVVEWVAEYGIRDEEFTATPTGAVDKPVEPPAGFIAAERHAGLARTEPSRGFAHEHDRRVDGSIQSAENADLTIHCRAGTALLCSQGEVIEIASDPGQLTRGSERADRTRFA